MTSKIIPRIEFDPEFEPISFERPSFSAVIEQELLTGIEKAEETIERARKEAARLRKRAKEILAQAVVEKEEERRRGNEEGVQEGLAQLTERIVEAERAYENRVLETESQIVRMVMEIAEKVIGREVERGAVVDVVKKAISQSVGQKITIRVHPSDFAVIKEKETELLAEIDRTQSITVKEDEAISAGGCILETEMGSVDARLETQLKAIRKALGLG